MKLKNQKILYAPNLLEGVKHISSPSIADIYILGSHIDIIGKADLLYMGDYFLGDLDIVDESIFEGRNPDDLYYYASGWLDKTNGLLRPNRVTICIEEQTE